MWRHHQKGFAVRQKTLLVPRLPGRLTTIQFWIGGEIVWLKFINLVTLFMLRAIIALQAIVALANSLFAAGILA